MISTISPKRNFERMVDENFNSLPSNHHYSPSKLNTYPKKIRTQEKLIELKHQFQNDSPFKIKEPFEIDMNVVKRLKRRRELQSQKGNNNNNNIGNNNYSPFNNNNTNNNNNNISPYNNNNNSPFNNFTPFQYNSPNKNQVNSNFGTVQQPSTIIDPSSEKEKLLSEQLFSANDVKKMVEERENKLINEFTQILLERLDQQYQTFAQYTEDCLSRQMKSSEFDDYIS